MPKLVERRPYYENRVIRGMVVYLSGKSWRQYQRWCKNRGKNTYYKPANIRKYLYSHNVVKKVYRPKTMKEVVEMVQATHSHPKKVKHFSQLSSDKMKTDAQYKNSELYKVIHQIND